MQALRYEGDVFRPPSEAKSLILQVTLGCAHNRCTFCGMYKRKKFRERGMEEITADIGIASELLPRARRVFLADGNALTVPTGKLIQIMGELNRAFPVLERVTLYGNPQDLLEKSIVELAELKKAGLGMIYLGVESGSAAVLEAVGKGVSPDEIAAGASRSKTAGIPLSITVINGLAGVEGSAGHVRETARLLNRIDPEYLGLLSLMTVPGTIMHRQFREGKLTALDPWQLLEEIAAIVGDLDLSNCVFRANHASNYLPLKAVLSRDRQLLLRNLEKTIAQKSSRSLRGEFMRGL